MSVLLLTSAKKSILMIIGPIRYENRIYKIITKQKLYVWPYNKVVVKLKSISGVILIKKAGDGSQKIKGCWDSIHVVEVIEKSSGRNAHYKLTSTAMLWLQTNKESSGTMNLGGSLTRQVYTWLLFFGQ